jgi:hypothetical protein
LALLATGALAGDERAAVLRHTGTCAKCRAELAELARVADGLLLLAPELEPPAGFESAVIAQISAPRTAPHAGVRRAPHRAVAWRSRLAGRRVRTAAAAAVLAIAMATGSGVVWWGTEADRRLASQTRDTLEITGGRYLQAARLITSTGVVVGTAFMYQGDPSWLLLSMSGVPADGPYDVTLVKDDGTRYGAGTCQVANGAGTTAYRLHIPVASIAAIEMIGPSGVRLAAQI